MIGLVGVNAFTSTAAWKGLVCVSELEKIPTYRSPVKRSNKGVSVPIFSVIKTLADVFRSKVVDRSVAIEALRAALQQRKASPAAITETALANGAWRKMKPYLEALTSNG